MVAPPAVDPLAPFSPAVREWFAATFEVPVEDMARLVKAIDALLVAHPGDGHLDSQTLWLEPITVIR